MNCVAFNIRNKKLWDYLLGLGFNFDNSRPEDDDPDLDLEDGVFSDETIVTLPSGIEGFLNWEEVPEVLSVRSFKTVSEWITHVIKKGYNWYDANTVVDVNNIRDYDGRTWKYSEAEKELSQILTPDRMSEIAETEEGLEYALVEYEDCDEDGYYNVSERIEVKERIMTVKIPTESLFTGEEFDEDIIDEEPGEVVTKKWVNGHWITAS